MDNRDLKLEFNSKGMKNQTKQVAGSVDFSIPGSLLGGQNLLSAVSEGDYASKKESVLPP